MASLSLSLGGHQWYHIRPGPADGKAVRWRRLPHRFPRGGSVSGWHRHQRRAWTDLLPSDRNAQRTQQSGPGLFVHWNKWNQSRFYDCKLTYRLLLSWKKVLRWICFSLYLTTDLDSSFFSVLHPLVQSIVHTIFPFCLFFCYYFPPSFIHPSAHPGSTSRVPRCKIHTHTCCGCNMGERCGIRRTNSNRWTFKQGKMDGGTESTSSRTPCLSVYWFMTHHVARKYVFGSCERHNPKFLEDVHYL